MWGCSKTTSQHPHNRRCQKYFSQFKVPKIFLTIKRAWDIWHHDPIIMHVKCQLMWYSRPQMLDLSLGTWRLQQPPHEILQRILHTSGLSPPPHYLDDDDYVQNRKQPDFYSSAEVFSFKNFQTIDCCRTSWSLTSVMWSARFCEGSIFQVVFKLFF